MKLDRRTRTAALFLVLALLAGLPGVLSAACGRICPARTAMPCCQASDAPTVKAPSCCEALKTLAPAPASRAVQPAPFVTVALAAPLALPAEPLADQPALPAPPHAPPLLHEGIGLYT